MNRERHTRAPRLAPARRALVCATLAALAGLSPARAQSGRSSMMPPPPLPQQTPPPPPPRGARSSTMRMELPPPVGETPVPFVGGGGMNAQPLSFVTPDANFDQKLVKNSPFSADSTTESVQTLAGGNRLVRKSAARIFRDSAGRTRREHTIDRGARAAGGDAPKLVVINDPVAQVNYLLETATNTARRQEVPPGLAAARARAMGGASSGGGEGSFGVLMPTSAAHRRMAQGDDAPAPAPPKKEKLEAQIIEGVQAEGTRVTVTIPVGEFDNELPLEITHEQWYSPELQMIVLMKHNDPRFGETTFRLTNITRGEIDHALFELPQNYRVISSREEFFFPGRPRPARQP